MNIPELFDTLVNNAEQYGFWIILLLAILHPLTENPWSFLTMSIGLRILGIPLGYGTIFLGNIIGIILLYLIFHGIHQKTNYIAQQKKISKKVLESWLIWIVCDIFMIILMCSQELWWSAGLYVLLLMNASNAYLTWKNNYDTQRL